MKTNIVNSISGLLQKEINKSSRGIPKFQHHCYEQLNFNIHFHVSRNQVIYKLRFFYE